MMRRFTLGLVVLLATGCGTEPDSDLSSSSEPVATSATATPSSATPSNDPASDSPVPEPQLPTGPAPTEAGELSEDSLIIPEGWEPATLPGSADDGYYGNGTWVHAVDPVLRGSGTLAVGCIEEPPDLSGMVPIAALEGTLEQDGKPGIVLAMQFESDEAAQQFFDSWLTQVEACVGSMVEKVEAGSDHWTGYRQLDVVWSEAARVTGDTARFVILSDQLDEGQLAAVADQLNA